MESQVADVAKVEHPLPGCGDANSALEHRLDYALYGHHVSFEANDAALLDVARISSGCFSRCSSLPKAYHIAIQLCLDRQLPADPLPLDQSSRLRYALVGHRLVVASEPWVRAVGDMDRFTISAVVSQGTLERPVFLSRYICDNFALHMLMRTGDPGHVGHLHACTLAKGDRAVLLVATHNVGKTTTALRLMSHGYRLLTDSTSFVRFWGDEVELMGYSIGRLRLRPDVAAEFPALTRRARHMILRNESKFVVDLRQEMPEQMFEESIWPAETVVCHMERTHEKQTLAEPLSSEFMMQRVWPESAFADDDEINPGNRLAVERLLGRARCYRLLLGTCPAGIFRAVENL